MPINDKRMYPVYAKCCELDIPVLCCVGVPGPRVPMMPQKVELIDEVCWFVPELKFVMRHGADPLTDLVHPAGEGRSARPLRGLARDGALLAR